MNKKLEIDIDYDFRADTPAGKDPDSHSPTLRLYHKHLWSKQLPSGKLFQLEQSSKNGYLHHKSDLGEFFISSDSAIHTFRKWPKLAHIVSKLNSNDIEHFARLGYTIGGMLVFPSNRVDGKATINGARGMHPLIRDRIDLTLECIRRYYNGIESPLSTVIGRYNSFFDLFSDFKGYVDFFLLNDLVSDDYVSIKFFMPFEDFNSPVLPSTLEEYEFYKNEAMTFVTKRNQRVLEATRQLNA